MGMGDQIQRQFADQPRLSRKRPAKQSTEAMGRRLLEIVVYDKYCRIGGTLPLDDLAETAIGDWKVSQFKATCAYAVSHGLLIVVDNALTLRGRDWQRHDHYEAVTADRGRLAMRE
jgi:hypothetical protein